MRNLRKVAVAWIILVIIMTAALAAASFGVLRETRRDALIAGIKRLQSNDGSFAYGSAEVLLTLDSLHSLEVMDLNSSIQYLISYTDYEEMYHPSLVVQALNATDALDRANRTMFIDLALKGYNSTSGAFFEPIRINDGGTEEAYTHFPIGFRLVSPQFAYRNDNVINTYLGINMLEKLGVLDRINATKTVEWVLSCGTASGGFKPFPNCTYRGTDFDVDLNCSGIAFTYCAVETLRMLGQIDRINKTETRDYVLSCYDGDFFYNRQHPAGSFYVETGWTYNWWAMKTSADIEALNPNGTEIPNVIQGILDDQYLHTSGWPIPYPTPETPYGLLGRFYGDTAISGTYYSVMILSEVDLSLLDQLTPRALACRNNIFMIATIALLLLAAALFIVRTYEEFEKRARKLASEQIAVAEAQSNGKGNEDNGPPESQGADQASQAGLMWPLTVFPRRTSKAFRNAIPQSQRSKTNSAYMQRFELLRRQRLIQYFGNEALWHDV
jgi:hypothetical protein